MSAKLEQTAAKLAEDLAAARADLASWPSRYEEVTTELARAREEISTLQAQVNALVDVQQHLQQAHWFNARLHANDIEHSSRSTAFVSPRISAFDARVLGTIKDFLTAPERCILQQALRGSHTTVGSSLPTQMALSPRDYTAKSFSKQSPFSTVDLDNSPLLVATDKRAEKLEARVREQATAIEDLQAHLSTHASTKHALVKKLHQVEAALVKSMEERDQSQAQISSDKQVIFYLDQRVQALESSLQEERAHRLSAEQNGADEARRLKGLLQEKQHWEKNARLLEEEVVSSSAVGAERS